MGLAQPYLWAQPLWLVAVIVIAALAVVAAGLLLAISPPGSHSAPPQLGRVSQGRFQAREGSSGRSAERDFHRYVVLWVVGRHFLSAVLGPELVNDFSNFSRFRDRGRARG